MDSYVEVVVFVIAGLMFPVVALWVSWLFRPHNPNPTKLETYECGEVALGDARVKFHIRYYIFALIFVVFDVETIFLYPWAVMFKHLGLFGFIEMIMFIAVLCVGLMYAWKKKVLRWS